MAEKKEKMFTGDLKMTVRNILLLLCGAALIEILLFNFRSIQSLFYEAHSWEEYDISIDGVNVYEDDIISIQDETATIMITDMDLDVKNVRLELEPLDSIDLYYMETGVCHTEISVVDEGNAWGYPIAGRPVLQDNITSQFQWLQPLGNVDSMHIKVSMPTGHLFRINGITFNAKRPLVFSVVRAAVIWLMLLLGYGLRRKSVWWREDCMTIGGWKKTVLIILFAFFYGISWFLMSKNQGLIADEYIPYQELAWALEAGQVSLLDQPPQELVSMENPYDYFMRIKMETDDKFDFAYYQGKYYVYHGILPCLLFYWPVYHLTGLNMPNSVPVFFCSLFFGIGFVCLMRQIIIRYFRKTPFAILVLLTLTALFGCQLPYFITQPTSYVLTIICAVMLVVWGLYFWLSAKNMERGGYSKGRIIAGSVCMALVAAVRPTLLIYSVLAFVIFGRAWLTDKEGYGKRDRVVMMILFAIPYVVVALPLMYYNYIRFDSPFDFGMRYNLTAYDLNHLQFSLDRIYYAIGVYFLRLPDLNFFFPYISASNAYWNSSGHSLLIFEVGLCAGLIPLNLFLLAAAVVFEKKKEFQKKGLYIFCFILTFISILILVLDVELTASIAYRYQADFAFALFIVAWIGILKLQETYEGKMSHEPFRKILILVVMLSVVMNAMFWFMPPSEKFSMQSGNTQLYYDIYYGFNFW